MSFKHMRTNCEHFWMKARPGANPCANTFAVTVTQRTGPDRSDHWQPRRHNCPNPKVTVTLHKDEQNWVLAILNGRELFPGKILLKIHHLCGLCLTYSLEVPQKPSPSPPPQCSSSSTRIWDWGTERGLISSPNSPHLLLQTSFPFFCTTTTCCLLQGMMKLYVFLFYSSFVFPSFICSFLYPLILIVWPLENEAYSLTSGRKNSCLGDRDYGQILKIMEHLCQKNVSCFFICLGKVLLLYEAEELLSLPMYRFIFPGQNQEAPSPFS